MSTPPEVIRYPVAPPPAAPRPFGLLSVAVDGSGSPGAGPAPWERGVDYYSPNCGAQGTTLDGYCPVPDETEKELTPFDPTRVEGAPFTVTSGTICTAPTFDAEAEARAQLARGEGYRVEDKFFEMQLARPDLEALGSVDDMACALGLLEGWAGASYVGRPVLHMPLLLMPLLFREHLARVEGDQIVTQWGTPIAAGAGYGDRDTTTILVTGVVTMWRTEVFVNSDFDVRKNERFAIAERTYVLTADCIAATVTVPGCPGGEPA